MMDAPPSTSTTTEARSGTSNLWWIVVSVIATIALALMAAHAPSRIRLIGIFSIAFGLVIGWLLPRLARQLDCHPSRRFVALFAVILTIGGLVGCTWQTWHLEQSRRGQTAEDVLAEHLLKQMATLPPGEAQAIKSLPLPKASPVTEFRFHLAHRVSQLGNWPSPWPEVFWCVELVAAAIASFVMARLMCDKTAPADVAP